MNDPARRFRNQFRCTFALRALVRDVCGFKFLFFAAPNLRTASSTLPYLPGSESEICERSAVGVEGARIDLGIGSNVFRVNLPHLPTHRKKQPTPLNKVDSSLYVRHAVSHSIPSLLDVQQGFLLAPDWYRDYAPIPSIAGLTYNH